MKEDLVSEMVKDRLDDHEVKVKVNSGVEVIVGETRMVESKVLESSVGMNEVNGGMSDHSAQLLQDSTKINRRSDNNSYDSDSLLCRDHILHVVVDGPYTLFSNVQDTDDSTVNNSKKVCLSEIHDVNNYETSCDQRINRVTGTLRSGTGCKSTKCGYQKRRKFKKRRSVKVIVNENVNNGQGLDWIRMVMWFITVVIGLYGLLGDCRKLGYGCSMVMRKMVMHGIYMHGVYAWFVMMYKEYMHGLYALAVWMYMHLMHGLCAWVVVMCIGYSGGLVLRYRVMKIWSGLMGLMKSCLNGKTRKCTEATICNSYRSLNLCMLHVYSKYRIHINNYLLMLAEWFAVYVWMTREAGGSVTVVQAELRDKSSVVFGHRVACLLTLSSMLSFACDPFLSLDQSCYTKQTSDLTKSSFMSSNERQGCRFTGYADTDTHRHIHNICTLSINFECLCVVFYVLLLTCFCHVVVGISSRHVLIDIFNYFDYMQCIILSIMCHCILCIFMCYNMSMCYHIKTV